MENELFINKDFENVELDGVEIPLKDIISDKETMMFLIKRDNRPDFYYLCSDKLKKDYDFVMFLLNHIKNVTLDNNGKIRDMSFIKVVNSKNASANVEIEEEKKIMSSTRDVDKLLLSIISNYMNDENEDRAKKRVFSVAAESITVLDDSYEMHTYCNNICRLEFVLALQRMEDFKLRAQEYGKSIGLGFYYVRSCYNHYNNLLEVFAKAFIEKIFSKDRICLEEELHKEFYSPEHLEKYGINTYLLHYILRCDVSLYAFLESRKYLLYDKYKEIEGYIKNWDNYVNREKMKRYQQVFEKVREYINDGYYERSYLSELDIMAYIVNELELPKGIFSFDKSGYILTREVLNNLNYEFIGNMIKNSKGFADRRMYEDIKRIFIETLDCGFKTDNKFTNPTFNSARNDLYSEQEPTIKCRILTPDFKNKKLDK